jgi:hypothetical protein
MRKVDATNCAKFHGTRQIHGGCSFSLQFRETIIRTSP